MLSQGFVWQWTCVLAFNRLSVISCLFSAEGCQSVQCWERDKEVSNTLLHMLFSAQENRLYYNRWAKTCSLASSLLNLFDGPSISGSKKGYWSGTHEEDALKGGAELYPMEGRCQNFSCSSSFYPCVWFYGELLAGPSVRLTSTAKWGSSRRISVAPQLLSDALALL